MMPSLTCKRIFLIVLDSFGIGELPDAAAYGDAGSNTLASISHSPAFRRIRCKGWGFSTSRVWIAGRV